MCMASLLPTRYYLSYTATREICNVCPEGCACASMRGCYSCEKWTLRLVSVIEGSELHDCTQCVDYATEVDGRCVCIEGRLPVNGSCSCLLVPYYLFARAHKCLRCPYGCKCDEVQGCYEC